VVSDGLDDMQAGHYNSHPCIGGGLDSALDELETTRARDWAKKVIILMTDGRANINRWGKYDLAGAKSYALDQAERAAGMGVRIYCISVGVNADRILMQQIASIGRGQEYFASGDDPDEYTAQLKEIFGELGGRRPIALIK
jgi:hypothetical protein